MKERELFRYLPGNDPIRGFDPRLKLISVLIWASAISLLPGAALPLLAAAFLPLAKLAHVSLIQLLREGKSLVVLSLLLFTAAYWSQIAGGAGWKMALSAASVRWARFTLVLVLAQLLIETTSSGMIASALYSLCSPFSKAFAEKSALAIRLTIRFIPLFFDTIDTVDDAVRSRALSSSKKPLHRLKSRFLPLFTIMIEDGDEITDALRSRGITDNGRMKQPPLSPICRRDLFFFLIALVYPLLVYGLTKVL